MVHTLLSMWDLPAPGGELMSLALAGGFFTTEPPGTLEAWTLVVCPPVRTVASHPIRRAVSKNLESSLPRSPVSYSSISRYLESISSFSHVLQTPPAAVKLQFSCLSLSETKNRCSPCSDLPRTSWWRGWWQRVKAELSDLGFV